MPRFDDGGPVTIGAPARQDIGATTSSGRPVYNVSVTVNGARGNTEIRQMVAEGVTVGIAANEHAKVRRQQTAG
jgi:hypothetical protein